MELIFNFMLKISCPNTPIMFVMFDIDNIILTSLTFDRNRQCIG